MGQVVAVDGIKGARFQTHELHYNFKYTQKKKQFIELPSTYHPSFNSNNQLVLFYLVLSTLGSGRMVFF